MASIGWHGLKVNVIQNKDGQVLRVSRGVISCVGNDQHSIIMSLSILTVQDVLYIYVFLASRIVLLAGDTILQSNTS
jgi:hypothetical protein